MSAFGIVHRKASTGQTIILTKIVPGKPWAYTWREQDDITTFGYKPKTWKTFNAADKNAEILRVSGIDAEVISL